MVKPGDKQNVPSATKFMLNFIDSVRNEGGPLPYRLQGIKAELNILTYVFEALLSFYVCPDVTISSQIKSISLGAHALLYLHHHYKSKVLSNQLVHDIQATFQDAIFCCAKAKEYFPNEPLYLVKNGTDPEESFFGVVRAKYKNANLDSLEFIHGASAISQIDDMIMNKHPEWAKKSSLSKRLCLDYSSVDIWDKEKLKLNNVDICGMFRVGQLTISSMILEHGMAEIDFNSLSDLGYTFMQPFGKPIGVDDSEVEWDKPDSEETDDEESDADSDEEIEDSDDTEDLININIGDYIAGSHDVTVEIDGKHVYKATCVKDALSAHPLSKDRLKRVRTMTSTSSNEAPAKLLHLGDPVVASKDDRNIIANIKSIKSANKSVKFIDMALLEAGNLKFELLELVLEDKEEKFYWTGDYSGDMFTLSGKDCIPIQPDVDLEMSSLECTSYYFDKQLVLDIGVHLQQHPSDTMVSARSSGQGRGDNPSNSTEMAALKPCLLCDKETTDEKMRGHVAYHIITSNLSDVCGFCGREGTICQTTLEGSSHSRSRQYFANVVSTCNYEHDYKRCPNDTTKTHKCTNKIVHCKASNCNRSIWRYNAVHHYENNHPNLDIPVEFLISEKEKQVVLKNYKLLTASNYLAIFDVDACAINLIAYSFTVE